MIGGKVNDELFECERIRLLNETNVFLALIKQEQSKMTREEAYEKLFSTGCETRYGAKGNGDIVNTLEALGLLKFDEVKSKLNVEWRNAGTGYHCWFSEGYDPNHASDIRWVRVGEVKKSYGFTLVEMQEGTKIINAKSIRKL